MLLNKIKQAFSILRLTGFRYFRASQLKHKNVTYTINNIRVVIEGQSVLSMLIGIVISDEYHLKKQHHPKTIIDVGANVGIFSIYAAILFPDCNIFAFEPSTENFKLLRKNTQPFSNIHCLNKGVSNYEGIAYLSGASDRTAFQISTLDSSNAIQQCEVITLPKFLASNKIKSVDLLKLDCEGAEYDIAKGNLKYAHHVVGEYHRVENQTSESLKNAFINQGFLVKQWTGFPDDNAGMFWAVNNSLIA